MHCKTRKDAGVVDRDGLENRCTGNGTEGSNPSLSAKPAETFSGLSFFDGEMSIMTLRNGEQADDLRHCSPDILQCHSFVDGIAQRHWMVLN